MKRLNLILTMALAVSLAWVLFPAQSSAAPTNIAATTESQNNMTRMFVMMEASGTMSQLESGGPYTVFAPSDQALSQPNTLNILYKDSIAALSRFVKYHVVSGKYQLSQLKDGQTLQTLAGQPLTVHVRNGKVTINGAQIINQGIQSSNGIIYLVNGALSPTSSK